jgi:hypothetical protein
MTWRREGERPDPAQADCVDRARISVRVRVRAPDRAPPAERPPR